MGSVTRRIISTSTISDMSEGVRGQSVALDTEEARTDTILLIYSVLSASDFQGCPGIS